MLPIYASFVCSSLLFLTVLCLLRRDLTGSARAFLNETALPAVRALNGAGAPTLLQAMHRIVNAVQPGLIGPEAALYGH